MKNVAIGVITLLFLSSILLQAQQKQIKINGRTCHFFSDTLNAMSLCIVGNDYYFTDSKTNYAQMINPDNIENLAINPISAEMKRRDPIVERYADRLQGSIITIFLKK